MPGFSQRPSAARGWYALQTKEMVHKCFLSCVQGFTADASAQHFLHQSFICQQNSHPIKRAAEFKCRIDADLIMQSFPPDLAWFLLSGFPWCSHPLPGLARICCCSVSRTLAYPTIRSGYVREAPPQNISTWALPKQKSNIGTSNQ